MEYFMKKIKVLWIYVLVFFVGSTACIVASEDDSREETYVILHANFLRQKASIGSLQTAYFREIAKVENWVLPGSANIKKLCTHIVRQQLPLQFGTLTNDYIAFHLITPQGQKKWIEGSRCTNMKAILPFEDERLKKKDISFAEYVENLEYENKMRHYKYLVKNELKYIKEGISAENNATTQGKAKQYQLKGNLKIGTLFNQVKASLQSRDNLEALAEKLAVNDLPNIFTRERKDVKNQILTMLRIVKEKTENKFRTYYLPKDKKFPSMYLIPKKGITYFFEQGIQYLDDNKLNDNRELFRMVTALQLKKKEDKQGAFLGDDLQPKKLSSVGIVIPPLSLEDNEKNTLGGKPPIYVPSHRGLEQTDYSTNPQDKQVYQLDASTLWAGAGGIAAGLLTGSLIGNKKEKKVSKQRTR